MREKKRLKLAKRQLMLAQIARREARFALANAIGEEERSGKIHARANALLSEYEKRLCAPDQASHSHILQANLTFVRSLQSMADDAGQAHRDAKDQSQWQMQSLARQESRLDNAQERFGQERRAMESLREKREVPHEPSRKSTSKTIMARKLQMTEQAGDEAASKRAS